MRIDFRVSRQRETDSCSADRRSTTSKHGHEVAPRSMEMVAQVGVEDEKSLVDLVNMDAESELKALAPHAEDHPMHVIVQHREWNAKGVSGNLAEGTVVCFSNEEGLPLKVVRHPSGKFWELVPTSVCLAGCSSEREDDPVHFLSPECVFTVCKKDERSFGFRSWAAEGRLLQQARNTREKPRVTNYNFGGWETWRLVGNALQNAAFKTDLSAWNVSECRVQVASMMTDRELRRKHEVREIRQALLMTEEKREEAEDQYKHALGTCQAQMEMAARQHDELRARLAENLATNECLSTEVLEHREIQKRSQATVRRLTQDTDSLKQRERTLRDRLEQLEETRSVERSRAKDKLRRQKEKYADERRKLRGEMTARIIELEEENEGLRKALDSIASKISQFSAKNSPAVAPRPAHSAEEGEVVEEEGRTPVDGSVSSISLEDFGAMDDEDFPSLEEDYPIDPTLASDEPEAEEIQDEEVEGLEEVDLGEASPEPQSTLQMLGLENSESSDIFAEESSAPADVDQAAAEEEVIEEVQEPEQEQVVVAQEESPAAQVIVEEGLGALQQAGGPVKAKAMAAAEALGKSVDLPYQNARTMGGGKRVSALPPSLVEGEDRGEFGDNKFESEDWWNSFTMQASIH